MTMCTSTTTINKYLGYRAQTSYSFTARGVSQWIWFQKTIKNNQQGVQTDSASRFVPMTQTTTSFSSFRLLVIGAPWCGSTRSSPIGRFLGGRNLSISQNARKFRACYQTSGDIAAFGSSTWMRSPILAISSSFLQTNWSQVCSVWSQLACTTTLRCFWDLLTVNWFTSNQLQTLACKSFDGSFFKIKKYTEISRGWPLERCAANVTLTGSPSSSSS